MLRPLLLRWAVLSLPLAFAAASAATWRVTADGTGDAPTIQAAIDSASDGDEVVLADGTYAGEGNRDVAFLGKAITVRSESNDPDACVIDLDQADRWEPRRGFLFQKGEDAGSILSSVTIRNGYLGSNE